MDFVTLGLMLAALVLGMGIGWVARCVMPTACVRCGFTVGLDGCDHCHGGAV